MNAPDVLAPPKAVETSNRGSVAGALLALFAIHVTLGRASRGPVLYEDGIGYLATAKFIAGVEPTPEVGPMAFYHTGYSFLLAPLFLVFESPETIHRAALVLNSLVASLHLLVLWRLGRDAFGLPPRIALAFAFLAALYPPYLLQSNFVWTESLLPVLFSLHVWLAFRLVRETTTGGSVAFGATGALLFLVHPRMLPIVAIAAALLLALAGRERLRAARPLAGLAVLIAAFVATRLWHAHVFETLWIPGSLDHAASWTGRIPGLDQAAAVAARGVGHFWYLTLASFGLAPLGILGLVGRAGREADPARRLFHRVLLAEVLLVFAVSAVFLMAPGRSDHLVYGRYNDVVLGPVLLAGLAAVRSSSRRRILASGWVALPALALLGAFVTLSSAPPEVLRSHPMLLTIPGILPFMAGEHALVFPLRMSSIAIGGGLVLAGIAAGSKRAAAALLAVLFVAGAFFSEARVLRPFVDHWAGILTIHRLVGDPPPAEIAYDESERHLYGVNGYPFWLPRTRFIRFDGRRERPPARLVISARDWVGEKKWGATLLGAERRFDQALWSVPPEVVGTRERWPEPENTAGLR